MQQQKINILDVFKEAFQFAKHYRYALSIFIVALFILLYALQASLDGLFVHNLNAEKIYLYHWFIRPIITQVVFALVILIFNGNLFAFQREIEHQKFPYFHYFKNLLYIYLIMFFLPWVVMIVIAEPHVSSMIVHSKHAIILSIGLQLLALTVYVSVMTTFYCSILHVLFKNCSPKEALRQSRKWVKPHRSRVAVIFLIQFVLGIVATIIIQHTIDLYANYQPDVHSLLPLILFTALSLLSLFIMIFVISIYLVMYHKLSTSAPPTKQVITG